MQVRQLEYFVSLCETLSFTNTARQFFISQTAVTQQIHALEEELGTPLFTRTKRRVALTPAGQLLREDAAVILQRLREAKLRVQSAGAQPVGTLKLGFIQGYERTWLKDALRDFHGRYPGIVLSLHRESMAALYRRLMRGDLDVVINHWFSPEALAGTAYHPLCRHSLCALVPAAWPLAHEQQLRPEDLRSRPFLGAEPSEMQYGETPRVADFFLQTGAEPQLGLISSDLETLVLGVQAALGFTLLPDFAVAGLPADANAVAIPLAGYEEEILSAAVWKEESRNLAIPLFLEVCREWARGVVSGQ